MNNRYDFPVYQLRDANANILYRNPEYNKEYTEFKVLISSLFKINFKKGLGQSNASRTANTVVVPTGWNQLNIESLGVMSD